ncbi:hypothetical protein [Brevibacterium casei]
MHFGFMYKIFTTQELTRLGFTHTDLRFARDCCLLRLSRGVYLVRHVCSVDSHRVLWSSIDEGTHDEFVAHGDQRDTIEALNAAVMAHCEVRFQQGQRHIAVPETDDARGNAASPADAEIITHISAALMHGLPVAYPVTHQVEVVRPGVNRRFPNLHVRGATIPKQHIQTTPYGLQVTTLERTLVDVARTYSLEISVAMLDDALRRKLTTPAKIRTVFAQSFEKRNSKRVELALDLADARRESPAESVAAVRFYQHGIVGMTPQVSFTTDTFGTTIRVDFCHQAANLIVEVDGIGKLYLGSGVPRDELERERRREQWLRDRGWRIVRISWKELFQEAKFEEIKRAVMGATTATTASTASAR